MPESNDDALEALPEDWQRGLAVVAHPDDMEYGAAAAVARWTRQGKSLIYVLVTDGERGMANIPPGQASQIRREEQQASCAVVGVSEIEFLGMPDGEVVEGLALRRQLATALRRHKPEVVLSLNFRDTWGGTSWNHSDHRAVGRSLIDSVRDAANRWMFPEIGQPWDGVRFSAFNASPNATHAVDTTDTFELGVRSLGAHERYLASLGQDITSQRQFLLNLASESGKRLGTDLATTFEVVS